MLDSIFSNEMAHAIAWTLIHSVWQITLVALFLGLILKITRESNASARFMFSMAALAICFILSLITFTTYYMQESAVLIQEIQTAEVTSSVELSSTAPVNSSSANAIEQYFPWILNMWFLGALVFLLKIAGAFAYMRNLVLSSVPHSGKLTDALKRLNKKFGINRSLAVRESFKIDTPVVIGYIKPVILFPIGLVNQLNISEVECIIAHELAHIKRHDFISNLVQMCAEALYYYHPGLWYISSCINAERENCCDDLAINCCGNKLSYARTLVKLQEIKSEAMLRPALAFSGKAGSFRNRILRILNQSTARHRYKDKLFAFILVCTTLFFGAGSLNSEPESITMEDPDIYMIEDCTVSDIDIYNYLDTIPKKKTFQIKKMTDTTSVEMKMEDGEIVQLNINGVDIDSSEFDNYPEVIEELKPTEDKDIVAVIPEANTKEIRVLFLDSLRDRVVRIDSTFMHMEFPEIRLHLENLREDPGFSYRFLLDSLTNLEDEIIVEHLNIDSILDLMPEKMPELYFFPEKKKIHEEIVLEFKEQEMEKMKREMGLKKKEMERQFEEFKLRKEDAHRLRNELEKKHKAIIVEDENIHIRERFDPETFEKSYIIQAENNYKNVSDKIMYNLLKDGLIQEDEVTELELGGKFLKVNGDKQPDNIWKKYKKIYEEYTGIELTKKSRLKFELDPTEREEKNIFFFQSKGMK